MNLIRDFRSGQSMIEVVIGIAVVVVLAISLITTTLITQKTATSAKNNSQATKLAQQTSEQLRVFRDRVGFSGLSAYDGCYKLDTKNNPDPSVDPRWVFTRIADACTTGTGDSIPLEIITFSRNIQFSDISGTNGKNVTITVSWTESAGPQSVVHNTRISAWCAGEIVAGPSPCPTP